MDRQRAATKTEVTQKGAGSKGVDKKRNRAKR